MKKCSKCKQIKNFCEFNIVSKSKETKYRSQCKKCIRVVASKYEQRKRVEINKKSRDRHAKNKEIRNNWRREYRKNKIPIRCKLLERLRKSLGKNLKRNSKAQSTKDLLGCSIDYFKSYIESKFTSGMTWENYGYNGWHLDHIKPCSSFDLTDIDQQKICFHYTNLQPLWATTQIAISYGESSDYIGNIEKGNKLIK